MRFGLVGWVKSAQTHHRARKIQVRLRRLDAPYTPFIEPLESRVLLSTCHVTRLSDQGIGKGFRGDLRYCINKVNIEPGPDAIDFTVTGTINLAGALPSLSSAIEIRGPGAELLTVRRSTGGDYRIFTVDVGGVIAISGLSLRDGNAQGGGEANLGGAIKNAGCLTLIQTALTSNTADLGGAIHNTGTLSIQQSTVGGNTARRGGAIFNLDGGVLTVEGTTISGNLAYQNAGTGDTQVQGGGIYNNGSLSLDSSTISGNTVRIEGNGGATQYARGGGIHNDLDGATTISNSTISENLADKLGPSPGYTTGGGIQNWGVLSVSNSTIARNTAAKAASTGGGIDTGCGCSKAELHNTIVALNLAEKGPDFKGPLAASGHNLFGDSSNVWNTVETDILDLDPLLGPLANNGGPTQTMALLPGSPAINTGDNAGAPEWDQRGPGFPRIVNGTIDIGAFEVQATGMPSSLKPTENSLLAALATADIDLSAGVWLGELRKCSATNRSSRPR